MKAGLVIVRPAGLLLSVVLAAGGCGPSAPVTGSPGASASPAIVRPSAAGSGEASLPAATIPAATGPTGPGLRVDASLLRVLPTQIDDAALEPDPTTAGQIAADPTLATSAEAIAVALAIAPGASAGDDLAIVSVIRLREGVFSEAWFATWRATYDQSACEVAGGVKGVPTQVSIAGRATYVGTCAGDAQTYHVHLADPTLIVSITAAGPRHFGELVIAGLAE